MIDPTELTTSYGDAMSARYDADFDAIFGGGDRGDLPFFQALAEASSGPLCEVGAGTGRVLLAVAEVVGRRRVTGVEPSPAMRARFADRLAQSGRTNVVISSGSFEVIPLPARSQGLLFGAFRSFQHVLTTEAQLRSLAEVQRVLRPGGLFALDLFDPAYHLLRRARATLGVSYRTARDTTLDRWESREVDRVAQRVDVTFRWVERNDLGLTISDESATYGVRYTFPVELEHLLVRAGFEAVELRGGYDGRPLGPTPRELVVVCRKPLAVARAVQPKRTGSKAAR